MKTALEILKGGREILSDPAKWTKSGWAAADKEHLPVDVWGKDAATFCAYGACARTVGARENCLGQDRVAYGLATATLQEALPFGQQRVSAFNDAPTTTHADILALFDRAIESLEVKS